MCRPDALSHRRADARAHRLPAAVRANGEITARPTRSGALNPRKRKFRFGRAVDPSPLRTVRTPKEVAQLAEATLAADLTLNGVGVVVAPRRNPRGLAFECSHWQPVAEHRPVYVSEGFRGDLPRLSTLTLSRLHAGRCRDPAATVRAGLLSLSTFEGAPRRLTSPSMCSSHGRPHRNVRTSVPSTHSHKATSKLPCYVASIVHTTHFVQAGAEDAVRDLPPRQRLVPRRRPEPGARRC